MTWKHNNIIIRCTLCLTTLMAMSCSQDIAEVPSAVQNNVSVGGSMIPRRVSSLFAPGSIERGAGYGYATRAQYCLGTTFRLFNLERLDEIQQEGTYNFVSDDFSPYSEEQVLTGDSKNSLNEQLSINAGVDVNFLLADFNAEANYGKTETSMSKYSFAMKRTKRIVYVRDLQYQNIIQYYKTTGDSTIFSPGFWPEWKALEAYNDRNEEVSGNLIREFVSKWGKGFVARSFMGGCMDFTMTIDTTCLSKDMNLSFALEASVGFILGASAEANTNYQRFEREAHGRYSMEVSVRGGNVALVATMMNGIRPEPGNITSWLESLNLTSDSSEQDFARCTMVDMKIASMANLFTGRVRDKINYVLNTGDSI